MAYADIVASVQPKCFVMENVPQVQNSKAYAAARKIFKAVGYGLTEVVLTASFYGVPQRRNRFFCIGVLGEIDGFLSAVLAQGKSETETTMHDYFGDTLGMEHDYAKPPYKAGKRRSIFSVDEPSLTIRTVNGNVPKVFITHKGDSCELNPSIRPLTTLERAAVQTFPPDFIWNACKTHTEKMIGNAVSVKLAEFVAKALLNYHSGRCL